MTGGSRPIDVTTAAPTPKHWGDIPTAGYGLGRSHYKLVIAAHSTGGSSSTAKTELSVALYCRSTRGTTP